MQDKMITALKQDSHPSLHQYAEQAAGQILARMERLLEVLQAVHDGDLKELATEKTVAFYILTNPFCLGSIPAGEAFHRYEEDAVRILLGKRVKINSDHHEDVLDNRLLTRLRKSRKILESMLLDAGADPYHEWMWGCLLKLSKFEDEETVESMARQLAGTEIYRQTGRVSDHMIQDEDYWREMISVIPETERTF